MPPKQHDTSRSWRGYARVTASSSLRNTRTRDRLAREIARHTNRFVTSNPKEAWIQRPRLLVTTLQLARNAGGDDFQIVVCADAESALAEAANNLPLTRWNNATWYAFRDVRHPLHPNEELQLEEVFGPVIYQTETARSFTRRKANVVFREAPRSRFEKRTQST